MTAGAFVIEHGAQLEGHFAGRDLHGALSHAAAAGRAVFHLPAQLAEQSLVDAALVYLRVVNGLHKHAVGHVLVARMELEGAPRDGHGADALALAAAGAGLHGGQDADELVLVGKAALAEILNEPVEGESVGADRKLMLDELGGVHDLSRIHALLEGLHVGHALVAEEADLGDADAVLAGNGAAHLLALGHHAVGDLLTVTEHIRVIGVHRDVDMAVAVARVHMARHDEARGLHMGLDFLDGFGEMGIFFSERGQERDTTGMHLVVRDFLTLKAADGRLGDVGEFLVELPVFHGETGEASHFLQGLAVGLGRAFEVHLLQERGKIGDAVDGNDHVFVDFEAGRPFGDKGKTVPVLPETVGFPGVTRHGDVHVFLLLNNLNDVVDALVEEIGIVAVHLHGDHGNGMAGVLGALGLVVDGLDVLGVELFHGRNMREVALLADAVAQADELADHNSGRAHAAAEEFHGHDTAVLGLRMDGEADFGDDAVRTFLLHAGESSKNLVGHVLAKPRPADLVALQVHHVAHAAAHVLHDKDSGLIGKDLVAGVVLTLNGDDFTGGGDHAPPQEVVDGGAVLKGHGAARVLGNVAAYGGGQL